MVRGRWEGGRSGGVCLKGKRLAVSLYFVIPSNISVCVCDFSS